MEKEVQQLKARLQEIELKLQEMSKNQASYVEVKERLDLKTQELDLLTQRIERTSYFQLQQQVFGHSYITKVFVTIFSNSLG